MPDFYNNPYIPYGGGYPVTPYPYGAMPQQPVQRQPMPPQQPQQPPMAQAMANVKPEDLPISQLRFLSESEAVNYVMDLNTKGLFLDRAKKVAVLKWCDGAGNSNLVKYTFDIMGETPVEPAVDMSKFVTSEQLGDFATKSDITKLGTQISKLEKKLTKLAIVKDDDE